MGNMYIFLCETLKIYIIDNLCCLITHLRNVYDLQSLISWRNCVYLFLSMVMQKVNQAFRIFIIYLAKNITGDTAT